MKEYLAKGIVLESEKGMEMALQAAVNKVDRDKNVNLKMTIGGEGSYTDGSNIVVDISSDMIDELATEGMTEDTVHPSLRDNFDKLVDYLNNRAESYTKKDGEVSVFAVSYHEVAHIIYTSWSKTTEFAEWVADDLEPEGIHRRVSEKYARNLANILEDGRIEKLMANTRPGTLKAFKWLNADMYKKSKELHELGLSLDSGFSDLMNGLLMLSKLGMMPVYLDEMDDEIKDNLISVRPLVAKSINAKNPTKAFDAFKEVHLHIRDLVIEQLLEESEDMEAFEQLLEALEDLFNQGGDSQQGEGEPLDNGESQGSGDGSITVHIGSELDDSSESEGSSSGSSQESSEENDEDEDGEGAGSGEEDSDEKSEKENKDGEDGEGEGEDSEKDKNQDGKDGNDESKQTVVQGDGSDKWSNENNQKTSNVGKPKQEKSNDKDNKATGQSKDDIEKEIDKALREGRSTINLPRERKEISPQKQKEDGNTAAGGIVGDFALSDNNTFVEHPRKFGLVDLPRAYQGEIRKLKRVIDEFYADPQFNLTGMDRGIIDTTLLPGIKMHNFNVFKQQGHESLIDPVVHIAWDGSGSMWGDKQYESARACAIIEGAFGENVPLKIINFKSGFPNGAIHYLVKDYDEVAPGKTNFSYSYGQNGDFGNGNNDGFSIKVSTEELKRRPEKDKILFVLSDGCPTSYSYLNPQEDVKKAVKEAQDEGITVISLFFGDDNFRMGNAHIYEDMYGKDNIINSPVDKITDNLIKVFKKLLLR